MCLGDEVFETNKVLVNKAAEHLGKDFAKFITEGNHQYRREVFGALTRLGKSLKGGVIPDGGSKDVGTSLQSYYPSMSNMK